jgi:hypothetical protein
MPFVSFYVPDDLLELARSTGFREDQHVTGTMLNDRYLAGGTDGLETSRGEELLLAMT